MKRIRKLLAELGRILVPLAILAAGIGGFLVFGQRPDVAGRGDSSASLPVVQTVAVDSFDGTMFLEVEGVAVPYRRVTLSAEVSGRVARKSSQGKAGSYVEERDFLLQIEETDYALEVARFENELLQSDAEIRAVDIDIQNTESLIELAVEDLQLRQKDLTRRQGLFRTKALSESELDEGQRLELASRNSLQTLQNQLSHDRQRKQTLEAARELIKVNLERAKVDLKRTHVISPLSGTVVEDYVEQNEFVRMGDPLFLLTEASRMEVQCSLRVEQLVWLWLQAGVFPASGEESPRALYEVPETDVQVVYEMDGVEYEWDGVLSRYEGTGLDAQTRLVPCRVRVDDPTRVRTGKVTSHGEFSVPALFTGMYVTVRIPIDPPVPLLALPAAALRPGDQVWFVRDGQLDVQAVKVVMPLQDRVIVREPAEGPLGPGARAITSPLPHVRRGMAVREAHSP